MTPPARPTATGRKVTERVRRVCEALPHVIERPSHGEATWFVDGKRSFASMSDHHHDDRVGVVFAAAAGIQEALVAQDPDRFYRPAYVGGRGWVGAYLDVDVDWDFVSQLLVDAWRLIAPPRLHAELEG